MAISECDFFNLSYNTNHKKFTRQSIEDALHLQGYDVWFPQQWSKYGFSRIILMVKTDLAVKVIDYPSIEDLPIIMVEIGSLKEPKTRALKLPQVAKYPN